MRGNEVTRPGTSVMITTVRPTPVARTRRSTSLGPIFGTGTVASRSGAPNSGKIIAFIVSARAMTLGPALGDVGHRDLLRPGAVLGIVTLSRSPPRCHAARDATRPAMIGSRACPARPDAIRLRDQVLRREHGVRLRRLPCPVR